MEVKRMKNVNIGVKDVSEFLRDKTDVAVIDLIKIVDYRDVKIYIRKIWGTTFEYLFSYKGELYTQYMILAPKKNHKVKESEINSVLEYLLTLAVSTINFLHDSK